MTRGVVIASAGMSVPARVVTNEELQGTIGVDPQWVETRTGIRERRYASPAETTSTLAAGAAQMAMDRAGVTAQLVDLVVCATCTPDQPFPSTACLVQDRLGLTRAGAIDVNAACAGFLYGVAMAAGMIQSGSIDTAVVIGAELLSRSLNFGDAKTAALFGDGAGAVVLRASDQDTKLRVMLGADGSGAEFIGVKAGGTRFPASHETVDKGMHLIHMNGREVYRSAVRTMSQLGIELGRDGFDIAITHQANRRILADCAAEMGCPAERFFINIDRYGNTSSASIPVAMSEAWEAGELKPGMRLLLLAFGAGFAYGGAAIDWTAPSPAPSEEPGLDGRLEVVPS